MKQFFAKIFPHLSTFCLTFVQVNEELKATGKFEFMDLHVDEAEHSMEMHLPYLVKVFQGYVYMNHDFVPFICLLFLLLVWVCPFFSVLWLT